MSVEPSVARVGREAASDRATTSGNLADSSAAPVLVPGAGARRLRVLVIAACPMPAGRGTPIRVERLSEALVARGHAVTIATYHIGRTAADDGGNEPIIRRIRHFRAGSLPPGPTAAKLFRYDPQLLLLVRRLLAEHTFDIIHAHHVEGLIAGALARHRALPLVYDAHTLLGSELPNYVVPGLQRLVRQVAFRLDGLLPRLADHTICAGTATRDALVDSHGLPAERVSVAVNGVEVGHFAAAASARAGGARLGPPRVLYTGTLAAYQDVDLLLRAFRRLRTVHAEARLIIASSGDFEPLRPLVRELGIESAIDLEADDFSTLPCRLARATVAVLPRTRCAGVPQKLLNYMAAGCPIVASAGSAALLEHAVSGLVVADHDEAGFAVALARLIEAPALATELGARARAQIVERYSWEATATAVEAVYDRLIAPGRAHVATV